MTVKERTAVNAQPQVMFLNDRLKKCFGKLQNVADIFCFVATLTSKP